MTRIELFDKLCNACKNNSQSDFINALNDMPYATSILGVYLTLEKEHPDLAVTARKFISNHCGGSFGKRMCV